MHARRDATPSDLLSRPLCTKYDVLQFRNLPIAVLDAAPARTQTIWWALGAHADGGTEVVGCWLTAPDRDFDWQAAVADLAPRGVEGVRCIAGPHDGPYRSQAGPEAPIGDAIPDRLRRPLARASETGKTLGRALARDLSRRARFSCHEAAMDYVCRALIKLERRFCWDGRPRDVQGRPVPAFQRHYL